MGSEPASKSAGLKVAGSTELKAALSPGGEVYNQLVIRCQIGDFSFYSSWWADRTEKKASSKAKVEPHRQQAA